MGQNPPGSGVRGDLDGTVRTQRAATREGLGHHQVRLGPDVAATLAGHAHQFEVGDAGLLEGHAHGGAVVATVLLGQLGFTRHVGRGNPVVPVHGQSVVDDQRRLPGHLLVQTGVAGPVKVGVAEDRKIDASLRGLRGEAKLPDRVPHVRLADDVPLLLGHIDLIPADEDVLQEVREFALQPCSQTQIRIHEWCSWSALEVLHYRLPRPVLEGPRSFCLATLDE